MELRLPVGIKINDKVVNTVELNEMDGFSRQVIGDKQFRVNPAKMTTALLKHCLVKLGDVAPTESDIRNMYMIDRNFLLMQLQLISVGNEVPGKYSCKWCDEGFEVIEDLNNLKFSVSDNFIESVTVDLKRGYKDKEGKLHTNIVLGLPNGIDDEVTSPVLRQNYGEWCNVILARKVRKFGDLDMAKFSGMGVKIMQSLNVKDLDQMVNAITVDLPGYDLRHSLSCKVCGKAESYILDMSSFF